MLCLSNNLSFVPPKCCSDSSSPQKTNNDNPNLSVQTAKTITSSPRRTKLRRRILPQPSVIQIERVLGAGSFRDGEPPGDSSSDVRKSVFDLFLGKALEGAVEKKLRTTGEWLLINAETRFQASGKGILLFVFQWMIPIWAMALLVACGVIKLPFSTPFLDDLIM